MANYSTNLKNWGSKGSEYPDGYSYLEGDQPVDAWDNYLTYNTIEDIQHLINLTNKRLETDSGASHPSSPEVGHVSHRTDTPVNGKETLYHYDGTNATWHRLFKADGDVMAGQIDMGGYGIKDSSGTLTLSSNTSITGTASIGGATDISGETTVRNSNIRTDFYDKQEGGTVASGAFVPIAQFGLADGQKLRVERASLSEDGWTTPAKSGLELVIAPEGASTQTDITAILSGDGTTLYDREVGNPYVSYTNTSGAHQTVSIGLDNGHFGSGYGAEIPGFGGFLARVV